MSLLKTVLHEIAEHLDLSPAHLARLHEDIELHDAPAGTDTPADTVPSAQGA